jgi:flagellar biogenesis protein FliO
MLFHVSRAQDPQEMEWIRWMQDIFFIIFLVGLGAWVIAEFYRAFWKRYVEDVVPEYEINIQLL